ARSGVSIRYVRGALPTTVWAFSSSATTEGTRFSPSSPGITTGRSPSMYATNELVVPRSIPTMRSFAMLRFSLFAKPRCARSLSEQRPSALQHLVDVAQQIAQVAATIQYIHHLVAHGHAIFIQNARPLLGAINQGIPFVPGGV